MSSEARVLNPRPDGRPRDLSIVMPTYNCLALTQACVESLRATLPADIDWELLLVDDGSSDGTRDWIRSVSNHQIHGLFNDHNLGYAGANNRAVAASSGRVLALLNNDLLLTPGWFSPLWEALRSPQRRIVGNVQRAVKTGAIDHAGIVINAKGKPEHVRELLPLAPRLTPHAAVTGACLWAYRSTWDEVGGFDTVFVNGGEDVDFCLRARRLGITSWVATRSVIWHHVSSSPNRKLRDEANSARLADRWRTDLVRLGAAAWVHDRLTRDLTVAKAAEDLVETVHQWVYWHGLTEFPPASSLRAVAQAIDVEISRWRELGVYPEVPQRRT